MLLPALALSLAAAMPQGESAGSGAVAFAQACLDATTDAVVLNVAAHPDDEAARTMVMLRHGHGVRTVTVYTTCGGGGQNAVGREIGPHLAAIRVRETRAAASHSGTEVRWLGFADFGYSKTRAETVAFWGGEEVVLERMAAVVDAVQPDAVFTNHGLVRGHGHHRASAWSIRAACSARELPLFERVYGTEDIPLGTVAMDPGVVDPVRGSTFAKQAHDGWREHRTQGPWSEHDPTQVRPERWFAVGEPAKALGGDPAAALPSMFDLPEFARVADRHGVEVGALRSALDAFGEDRSRAAHVAAARELLGTLRRLRAGLDDADPATRSLGRRLDRRLEALERVVLIGSGVTFDARLADARVSRGATAEIRARLNAPESAGVTQWSVRVADAAPVSPDEEGVAVGSFQVPLDVPAGDAAAKLTETVFVPVRAELVAGGLALAIERRVEVRLGPALAIGWPRDAMFVPSGAPWERIVSLEVESFGSATFGPEAPTFRAPAGVTLTTMPERVELSPADPRRRVLVRMRGDGSSTQRFILLARLGDAAPARIEVQPLAFVAQPSTTPGAGAVDVAMGPDGDAPRPRRVALVRGPDDTVERFLEDIGMPFEVLDETGLAVAELASFSTLLLDIRAYHHRPDLAHHRERILAFAEGGGRVVVSYHKPREWNERDGKPLLAPFGITVGNLRVSQEDAPIEILDAEHPLMRTPFALGPRDFEGWVQERGLNFPEKWDPEWVPLLRMHDEGEKPLDGSLLAAPHGQGDFVYCSLALYRQLRVGHLGGARIMINLLVGQ